MEDDKQLVRRLFKKPYSKQALDDALNAFGDLPGKDRRALTAEFLSSPLGKDFESLIRGLANAAEKLAPQLAAVAEFDEHKVLRKLIQPGAAELAREKRNRPEIVEAIIAVRGHNDPADHPYSVAARILPGVNAWLDSHGYGPVLIDALARKIPHT